MRVNGLELTENESRYLKLIYRKQEEESVNLKNSDLAEYFKIEPATVTEMLQNLAEKDLIKYKTYHGVDITKKGLEKARELLRKHRVLEVLFVKYLDFDPENACEEALKIDYHATSQLINSICKTFEHPDTCPCGKRIFKNQNCSGG